MDNDLNIDYTLKERNRLLQLQDDFEQEQNEFKEKKTKCSVKLKKIQKKNNEHNDVNNINLGSGTIKKVKGKKKVKDVISLDIPIMKQRNNTKNNVQGASESLFQMSLNDEGNNKKLNDIKEIDKETGLPQTFKIDNYDNDIFNKNKSESQSKNLNNCNINQMGNKINDFDFDSGKNEFKNNINQNINITNIENSNNPSSSFYDEIDKANKTAIKNMSKKEIEEAQKEILSNIPSELIAKMKQGFFKNKLQKDLSKESKISLKTQEQNFQSDLSSLKPPSNPQLNNEKIKQKKQSTSNKELSPFILYNYEAKTRMSNNPIYNINNNNQQEKIDFTKLTFNELELKNKYFSINEIFNLISSSNPIQITLGLKIFYSIIFNKKYLDDKILCESLCKYINALYYLIEHSNINIRLTSLKTLNLILNQFFYDDYKLFKYNLLSITLLPVHMIYNTFNYDSKELIEIKLYLIKLLKENYAPNNIYNSLYYSQNKEINKEYLDLLFYFVYINEKVDDGFIENILKGEVDMKINQRLMKVIFILCNSKYSNQLYKLINNKFYALFIMELRGISYNKDEITKAKPNKLKDKIYNMNYQLLKYNSITNNIGPENYLDETDLIYLSKALMVKIINSLYHNHKENDEEYISLISNDSQLKFFEDKILSCVDKLKDNESSNLVKSYYELVPIYSYMNSFLFLYNKSFKYPKIISYKKFTFINLDFIISKIYPLLNNHLSTIIEEIHKCNSYSYIYNDSTYKIETIFKYEIFLQLCLNFIKCFIKNYEINIDVKLNNFSLFLIKLSELINKGDEYYYSVYIKFIKNIITRKTKYIDNLYINYTELDEDLNFYLYSNDELRKSIFMKKIFLYSPNENNVKFDNFLYDKNTYTNKYFPFDQNFIYQIITNDKAKIGIKNSYLLILILLWLNNDYFNIKNNQITPFEICLRLLWSTKLSEFTENKIFSNTFKIFVNKILLNKENQLVLYNSDSNKMILDNYFKLFNEVVDIDKVMILYKTFILFILYVHNKVKNEEKKIVLKSDYVEKNIESIIYENYIQIISCEDSIEDRCAIKDFLLGEISMKNIGIYKTLILCEMKYDFPCEKNVNENALKLFVNGIIKFFGIDNKKEDYYDYLKNDKLLEELIKKKLNDKC